MNKRMVKWIVAGYMVLLISTAIAPLVSAEKSIAKVDLEILENVDERLVSNDRDFSLSLPSESSQPRWKTEQHLSIAQIAAKKVQWIEDRYIDILNWSSYEPDYPDFDPPFWDTVYISWDVFGSPPSFGV